MKQMSLKEFNMNSEAVLRGAAVDDEFVRVKLGGGAVAVVISEAEWNILMEALAIVMKQEK